MTQRPPTVLVIAGSDPSGGAGLEADQRVLALHGCYAMTATTALTVQNTQGVQDAHVVPCDFLEKQLEAVSSDIEIDVVKIGMLANTENIEIVYDFLEEKRLGCVVVDPVMISTSGHRLLEEEGEHDLMSDILPFATVLTPNIPEACLLRRLGYPGKIFSDSLLDPAALERLAKDVQALGPKAVLLKGGHVPLNSSYQSVAEAGGEPKFIIDILYDGSEYSRIESPYVSSKNTHGTGCSLASAVAANLARKKTLRTAIQEACQYVQTGINTSFTLGHGNGPINHFHSLQVLPFAAGHFLEYLIQRPDVQPVWARFTQHQFVKALGDGSLPLAVFKRFLVQDYLYLTQFARTNALAAYKSDDMDEIASTGQIILGVQKEMELHLGYCQEFGISREQMVATKESQATVAYSRYLLDIGQSGDLLGLQVAMASCLIGYQTAAEWLKAQPGSKSVGNKYWKWVDMYGGEDYAEGANLAKGLIEQHAAQISPHRVEELVRIFIRVTEMEIAFWEFDAHLR